VSPAAAEDRRSDPAVLAVVVNQLEAVVRQLADIVKKFDGLDEVYVRKGEYIIQRRADEVTMKDLRTDLDTIADQRRKLWMAIVTALVFPTLVGIIIVFASAGVHT
jgi:DNA-binding Lrp family transcriptional regulator